MKVVRYITSVLWLMDVMNLPFMEMFDTTYPLNGLFWVCALVLAAFM